MQLGRSTVEIFIVLHALFWSTQYGCVNGKDLEAVTAATHAAIDAALGTPGLVKISAGNYDGRLGKTFIHLRRDRNADATS